MESTGDENLDEFLDQARTKGVEPVSIDPYAGDHGIFGVETELTINGENFTGEVDYEVGDNGIKWYFLEVYLDENDERKPVLDESSADEIDHLLFEYKPTEEEIQDTLEVLREAYKEAYN